MLQDPDILRSVEMQTNAHTATPKILSAGVVRVARDRVPVASATECETQPRIHMKEQGGVIREIVVTCACGKCIVVECDYGASAPAR
jgi:hypothetical protein